MDKAEDGLEMSSELRARTDQLQKEYRDIQDSEDGLISDIFLQSLASHARKLTAAITAEERKLNASVWAKRTKILAIALIVLLYIVYDASGKVSRQATVEVYWAADNESARERMYQESIKLDENWHRLEIPIMETNLTYFRIDSLPGGEIAEIVEIADVWIGDNSEDIIAAHDRIRWGSIGQSITMGPGNILRLTGLIDNPFVVGHFLEPESTDKVAFGLRVVPRRMSFSNWLMTGQFLTAYDAMSWDEIF